MRKAAFSILFVLFWCAVSCDPSPDVTLRSRTSPLLAGISGAIFTTTPDGAVVNENVRYKSKLEVYMNGGPGPNAPQTAAGLPNGDYYFQVTDPSGAILLSEDPAKCRKVRVEGGVIVGLLNTEATYDPDGKGKSLLPCHVQDGPDGAAGSSGRHDLNPAAGQDPPAFVVQLMPFFDTPNRGGVYKAWMVTAAQYAENRGDPEALPVVLKEKGKRVGYRQDVGFGPPRIQMNTDNFKVKRTGPPCEEPWLSVRKFHDADVDGVWDESEAEITGWAIWIDDPLAVNERYTPVGVVTLPPGEWFVTEEPRSNTRQTVGMLDGVPLSAYPDADPPVEVEVTGACGEIHEVVFGNVGLGKITACKYYDSDRDGASDEGEPGVPRWKMRLEGTDLTGAAVERVLETGDDGCTDFDDLLPGSYTVIEVIPQKGGWEAGGALSQDFEIESTVDGDTVSGTSATATFANRCVGSADFDTKGYWQNQNGLAELTDEDIDEANDLLPYATASSYFEAGDEPFDGSFGDGKPVEAANGTPGEIVAPAGSAKAEVSHFLVDSNAGGDPREQLAQQLLAFFFNTLHRLGGVDVALQLPDGSWSTAGKLIDGAVEAWKGGTAEEQNTVKTLLDTLNNSDAVRFIYSDPCPVEY